MAQFDAKARISAKSPENLLKIDVADLPRRSKSLVFYLCRVVRRTLKARGLDRAHWANAGAAQKIFKQSFQAIGLHGFNPHAFRQALAVLGEKVCRTPDEFKAWSQNLGHEGVLTTLSSYGAVGEQRQAELIRTLGHRSYKGQIR